MADAWMRSRVESRGEDAASMPWKDDRALIYAASFEEMRDDAPSDFMMRKPMFPLWMIGCQWSDVRKVLDIEWNILLYKVV